MVSSSVQGSGRRGLLDVEVGAAMAASLSEALIASPPKGDSESERGDDLNDPERRLRFVAECAIA